MDGRDPNAPGQFNVVQHAPNAFGFALVLLGAVFLLFLLRYFFGRVEVSLGRR
jgi:hypothetical protein